MPTTNSQAQVVYTQVNQKSRIFCANQVALDHGITPGMSLNSARCLCPTLIAKSRSLDAEARSLQDLAKALAQLSPYVTLDTGSLRIHLEVARCMKMHNGFDCFWQKLLAQLGEWQQTAQIGLGPSMECASAFANQYPNTTAFFHQPGQFWQQWHGLSLEHIDLPDSTKQTLIHCGFSLVLDIVKLHQHKPVLTRPPEIDTRTLAALRRRFGEKLSLYWEKLCGHQENLRKSLSVAPTYCDTLELPCDVRTLPRLFPAIKTLLTGLEAFLIRHHGSVLCFDIHLIQSGGENQSIRITLSQPHYRAAFFEELAQLKLAQCKLTAPVIELRLQATELLKRHSQQKDLFDLIDRDNSTGELLSRLQARLGQQAIMALEAYPDYRPERTLRTRHFRALTHKHPVATRRTQKNPRAQSLPKAIGQQPLLMIEPMAITPPNTAPHGYQTPQLDKNKLWLTVQNNPHCQGMIALLQGPHHLSTGWWDTQPVQRSYYIAQGNAQQLYWIFRDDLTQQWFIQGFFS